MEAVGRLAGGIAHDFNNLLTAIGGFADLLADELAADDPRADYVTEIAKSTERATALTGQLLAFGRRQILQPKLLDLNVLVEEDARLLRRVIGEDVTLTTHPNSGCAMVKVDPGQISQVLLNLAVNARDAMPEGGTLTIETSLRTLTKADAARGVAARPGRYVLLRVSDTGHGIDEATRFRIFEPFFTTKEQGKGTGLGLSTVFGIVDQSGGFVDVRSKPGLGTSFDIYLPFQDDVAVESAEAAAPAVTIPRESATVLLAEDDDGVRAIACRMLEKLGYTVLVAASGEEALRVSGAHSGDITLLVTDIVMPGIDGRELARQLIEARPGLKVLYCSGYTDHAIVKDGQLEEGLVFLQKPYSFDGLARRIQELLDRSG